MDNNEIVKRAFMLGNFNVFDDSVLNVVYPICKIHNLDILFEYIKFKNLIELFSENHSGSEAFDCAFEKYLERFL